MQIETPRLFLREMTEADRDALAAILTDAETMKYYPKPYDDAGVRRWLDWTFDNYRKHGFGALGECIVAACLVFAALVAVGRAFA